MPRVTILRALWGDVLFLQVLLDKGMFLGDGFARRDKQLIRRDTGEKRWGETCI